jgi:hypothetical protein
MLGRALRHVGLERAQRIGAAERVDGLLDQVGGALGGSRLGLAQGQAQGSRQQ